MRNDIGLHPKDTIAVKARRKKRRNERQSGVSQKTDPPRNTNAPLPLVQHTPGSVRDVLLPVSTPFVRRALPSCGIHQLRPSTSFSVRHPAVNHPTHDSPSLPTQTPPGSVTRRSLLDSALCRTHCSLVGGYTVSEAAKPRWDPVSEAAMTGS